MSARFSLAAVWVDGDRRSRVGLCWKVKLPRVSSAVARGRRRERATGWRHLRCVHSSAPPSRPPHPAPHLQSPGRRDGRKDYDAGPYPPVPACGGGCVSGDKVLQLTAQALSSFQWMTASLSLGSPLPKEQKATPFSDFPVSPSRLSSVVFLIRGSDIQDRRKKRLKVIMVL